MFEVIFKRKKLNKNELEKHGFIHDGELYVLQQEIMNNSFTLYITIGENEIPDTKLIEKETNDEYVLYKTDAQGPFVGSIRTEIENILRQIADTCYETTVFKTRQAQMLIEFVRKTYGDELEFLWTKFPDNAVWRRKDNKKWYGAILTVQRNKLGLNSDEVVEIIDLRLQPELMDKQLAKENYYPGWHMNKKSWYTMILDGSISDKELCQRVLESYKLAKS